MIVIQYDETQPQSQLTAPPDRFYVWDDTASEWVKDSSAVNEYLRVLKDKAISRVNADLLQKTAIPAYYANKVLAANDIINNVSSIGADALKNEVDERGMNEDYAEFAALVIAKSQEHFALSCRLEGVAKRRINLIEAATTAEAIAGMM